VNKREVPTFVQLWEDDEECADGLLQVVQIVLLDVGDVEF
jgi:hypothetical protein